jgi:hypothetical protein
VLQQSSFEQSDKAERMVEKYHLTNTPIKQTQPHDILYNFLDLICSLLYFDISVKVPVSYHSLSLMDDRDRAKYRSRHSLEKAAYGDGSVLRVRKSEPGTCPGIAKHSKVRWKYEPWQTTKL